jgi:hypothetical protein
MAAVYTAESLATMSYRELQACCKANGEKGSGKVRSGTASAACAVLSASS